MKTCIFIMIAATLSWSQIQTQKTEFMGIKFGLPASAQSADTHFGELLQDGIFSYSTVSGERICGGNEGNVTYVNGNIENLICEYEQAEAPSLLEGLYLKYGRPIRVRQETVQTGMGVRVAQHRYEWFLRGIRILFETPSKNVETCSLSVFTPTVLAALKKNEIKKATKNAREF